MKTSKRWLLLAFFALCHFSTGFAQNGTGVLHARPGALPYDPNQPIIPYSVSHAPLRSTPAGRVIDASPEYGPQRGVLFAYENTFYPAVVDMVGALTGDSQRDEMAYVLVSTPALASAATTRFIAAGADMSKVQFIYGAYSSVWIRDFGPQFIRENGALSIVDTQYFSDWPLNNFVPTRLARDFFKTPAYAMGLYYSGGNFQPGPARSGFVTSIVRRDNPASDGFDPDDALISDLFYSYHGIDTLHILPQIPPEVDSTGHIDMWFYLVNEKAVIISEFLEGSNPRAIEITNNAADYMEGLGFRVLRTPAWHNSNAHYTYSNAVRVNNLIFVPVYGAALTPGGIPAYDGLDAQAMTIWEEAAGPGVQIVPIQSSQVIGGGGALHCITMQLPRFTAPAPAVCVVEPRGEETWLSGTSQTLRWTASDTDNVAIPTVDLFYSLNDGKTWTSIVTALPNTGSYSWQIPELYSTRVKIKVVAHSLDGDFGYGISEGKLTITRGVEKIYTFALGAGVDKWAWGGVSPDWSMIDGNPVPVGMALTTTDYIKLAESDATGGDTDTNRYVSPAIPTGQYSTHLFEFTLAEDPKTIRELVLTWEGYAARCTQVELYIWDRVAHQWGDGKGMFGQNRHMDNWAGIGDGVLTGYLRSEFERYIDPAGRIRCLIYAERPKDKTFHDAMKLTVKQVPLVQQSRISPAVPGVEALP